MKQIRIFLSFLLLGSGLIFLIYLSIINSYFLGEDYAWWEYVKGKNLFEVLRYFVISPNRVIAGFYHPLIGFFYWLNVNFSWMNPMGFHLTNLLIHLGTYLLVVAIAYFFFKRALPRRQAGWLALLAGFLFLIFPFHSEAVAWIDGRHDLSMTFFYLLSFYLFLRWNEDKERILLGFSVFSFFLALAAKEMAVTLPVALSIFLLRFQVNRHLGLTRLTPTVYYWLVLVFYFFLRASYVGYWNPFGAASHLGVIISRVLVFYLIFLGISLGFFWVAKKRRTWNQQALKLIPILAILIGVFYFPAAFIFTEERYLYLPSTVACIFVANFFYLFWTNKLLAQKKLAKLFLIFVLVIGSMVSVNYLTKRVDDWKKASEIAQGVVDDFKIYAKEIPEEAMIYFLNLPDNYHGSYIFRTHTREAMQYGSGKKFEKMKVCFKK